MRLHLATEPGESQARPSPRATAFSRRREETYRLARELHRTDVHLGRVPDEQFTQLTETGREQYQAGARLLLRLGLHEEPAREIALYRAAHHLFRQFEDFTLQNEESARILVRAVFMLLLPELAREGDQ